MDTNTSWRWIAGLIPKGKPTYTRGTKHGEPAFKCLLCGSVRTGADEVESLHCRSCHVTHGNLDVLRPTVVMNDTFPFDLDANGCPDCGHREFRKGPSGGMCRNVECVACQSRFNVLWGIGVAQRIEHNGMPFYDPSSSPWAD